MQDSFDGEFQVPYVRGMRQNKWFARLLAFIHSRKDFSRGLANE